MKLNDIIEIDNCGRQRYFSYVHSAINAMYPTDPLDEREEAIAVTLIGAICVSSFAPLIESLHESMVGFEKNMPRDTEEAGLLFSSTTNDGKTWCLARDGQHGATIHLEAALPPNIKTQLTDLEFAEVLETFYRKLVTGIYLAISRGEVEHYSTEENLKLCPCAKKLFRQQYKDLLFVKNKVQEMVSMLRNIDERGTDVAMHEKLVADDDTTDDEVQQAGNDLIVSLSKDPTRLFNVLRKHDSLLRKAAEGLTIQSEIKREIKAKRAREESVERIYRDAEQRGLGRDPYASGLDENYYGSPPSAYGHYACDCRDCRRENGYFSEPYERTQHRPREVYDHRPYRQGGSYDLRYFRDDRYASRSYEQVRGFESRIYRPESTYSPRRYQEKERYERQRPQQDDLYGRDNYPSERGYGRDGFRSKRQRSRSPERNDSQRRKKQRTRGRRVYEAAERRYVEGAYHSQR